MLLDLLEEAGILWKDEVNGGTSSSITSSSTNSMDVVLLVGWQFVVDDETDLLDIDTSSEEIGGDQDTDGSLSELLHNNLSLLLIHLSVHHTDDEVLLSHRFFEFLNSLLGVTVNQSLVDVQVGVQGEEHIDLPVLLLHSNIVLLDTNKSELIILDQDLGWGSHEMLGELQDILWHSGREQRDLDVTWQVSEDLLNLWLESTIEELISLIEDEHLQIVSSEVLASHHIMNTSWGTDDNMWALFENADVILDNRSSDTSVDLDSSVLSKGLDDESNLVRQFSSWSDNEGLAVVGGSVNDLQDSNGETSCLSCS